ncbi:acyltransferase [Jeotgalibaca porci]|uniref:acyltransferase n=1 Tax=Jeotgalibaca porci TaxID=1868793 RepID=UPI00359F63BD
MENANSVRDSNFELLRILSMVMIVVLHIGNHGLGGYIDIPVFLSGFTEVIYYFIRSLTIIAVSLYVLISGYFLSNSKFKITKLINLFLETSFFSIAIYLLNVVLGYVDLGIVALIKSMFSVFFGEYWFVTVYFVLYAISPFLNKLIDNINKKEHAYLLLLSFLISCIWQFVYVNEEIGVVGGYGLIYFMFLYFIGAYVRKYNFIIKNFNKNVYLLFYFLLAATNGLTTYISEINFGGIDRLIQYNSPLILAMSYCLFMYFKQLKIKSSKINFVSKYVFGIYLVHEQSTFRQVLWNEFGIVEDIISSNGMLFIVKMIGYSLIVFLFCWIVSFTITSIYNFLYRKLSKKSTFNKIKTAAP